MAAAGASGAAVVIFGTEQVAGASRRSHGGLPPASSTLIVVAHPDDNLLFISPDELSLIQEGGAVRVVYLTTGDAGRGRAYWRDREKGARAAAASMAGTTDRWHLGTLPVNGYSITLETLAANPNLSLAFVRLPDGGWGSGYPDTGYQTLMKLWQGTIPTISSADGYTFTTAQLTSTLAAIIAQYAPTSIYTQNFLGSYGNGDHTDHLTTAYFMEAAVIGSGPAPCPVYGYEGYPVDQLPANVSGTPLAEKEQTFYVYSEYDSSGCTSESECFAPGFFANSYGTWLPRQYVVAEIAAGSTQPEPVSST